VHDWSPEQIATAAQARLLTTSTALDGPRRVTVDSRDAGAGDLFVGLAGEHHDGGRFAAAALEAGAWGTLTTPEHAEQLPAQGVVLAADDPLAALQALAVAWLAELSVQVIGVTGSTGKTSTKDLLAGMLRPHRRTVATPQNLNTEIGLPMTILSAPRDTEVLVLEMAMRGLGQIAELAALAQPDVGVIVNIGPVHLELLGSITAIAAAKAELIAGLKPGGTAIVPSDEPLLDPHHRHDVEWVTFGPGGQVSDLGDVRIPFDSRHMHHNALAALAAARAIGVEPHGEIDVQLSARRGQRVELANGAVVINDCYNASPMSMRVALDELSRAPGRRVAVLGDMRELGPEAPRYHEEIGAYARERADVIVTVGPLAALIGGDREVATAAEAVDVVRGLIQTGDTILVKGSRGVGLEAVAEAL
jgi:UDP-N-acetylmuramoyl-tripeptide--D-alanyl-D-alanine ligase